MTWKAAHVFCSQQRAHLANSTDVEVIKNSSAFQSGNKQYWLTNAKVFSEKDLFKGWYWTDGSSLNASLGWLQNADLRPTNEFEKERCAVIQYRNGKIRWKDDFCDSTNKFICKPWRVRLKILHSKNVQVKFNPNWVKS